MEGRVVLPGRPFSVESFILHLLDYFQSWKLSSVPDLLFSLWLRFSGEMAKQMKVKKLKNLKTLDSKPGKLFSCSLERGGTFSVAAFSASVPLCFAAQGCTPPISHT